MKFCHKNLFIAFLFVFLFPPLAWAKGDLVLLPNNVRFSKSVLLEGSKNRIYATVTNPGDEDLKGVVRFFDGKTQIQGDQPVSVLAGKEDSVFVDFDATPGDHTITVQIFPYDNAADNTGNNVITKPVKVLSDSDRDGIPNESDADDDNDGTPDDKDAFPLNKNETLDTDGDGKGNNQDEDDDNDGAPDSDDALPLNPNEKLDTDKDGIGDNEDRDDDGDGVTDEAELKAGSNPLKSDTDGDNVNDNEDAYPLDSTQARDYDHDGIGDAQDDDADGDKIVKKDDVNDTNVGPRIIITSDGASAKRIIDPREKINFEMTQSTDSDGKIAKTEWTIDGSTQEGEKASFASEDTGFHTVEVRVTDDKGESRTEKFRVLVAPAYFYWTSIILFFLLSILAIYLIFSYSRPRKR